MLLKGLAIPTSSHMVQGCDPYLQNKFYFGQKKRSLVPVFRLKFLLKNWIVTEMSWRAAFASSFFSCFHGNEKFYSCCKIKSSLDKRQERSEINIFLLCRNKFWGGPGFLLLDNWLNFWQLYNKRNERGVWSRFCQNFVKESFLQLSWFSSWI